MVWRRRIHFPEQRMSAGEMNKRRNGRAGSGGSEELSDPVADTVRKTKQAMSLLAFMSRLIWLCVFPLVLLTVYLAGEHIHTLQTQRDRDAVDRVRNVANALDRNLWARTAALQVLASSPLVDDPPLLKEFYKEAHGYRENFGGHVILADLSMQMLFNTRVPFGAALPKLPQPKGHAAAPAVLATGKPAVGDMFFGPIAKEPLVAIVVPVIRNGQTRALLLSLIETRQFQQRLEEVALPDGWSLTVLDGKDEVMARRSPTDRGNSPSDAESPGRFIARLTVSPWSVVLAISPSTYRAPIVASAAALAASILAVTLVSVLGGRLASRRLARSVATFTQMPSPDTSGMAISEIEAVRTILNDTTAARDVSEMALRESEARFRATFDQAAVGMAQVALDGHWLRVNQRLCDIVGYSRDELFELTFQDITHPDDLYADLDNLRQVLAGGIDNYSMEKRYIRKNRSIVWVNLTVGLVRATSGTPAYFVSVVEDITERKHAEEAIRKLNEELEERVRERTAQLEVVNKELEAFSYSVSHDLKAPLRGIDGYSRLLEEDYRDQLDGEGRRFIRNIRQGAAQMHQLIEDLLNYSRMERRLLHSTSLDLPALVQALVAERMPEVEQSGVLLRMEVPDMSVRADRDGLAIVLRNLLENAFKFSHSAQPPTIEIGARAEGDRAILWVRDNGIGFDMKFHDRIFEIFQRLQRAEDYPGTGVGLALVRKAMQRMGGRAWAESAPGEGATFFLEIPL
jgi:PAS domain S-box-containing protein